MSIINASAAPALETSTPAELAGLGSAALPRRSAEVLRPWSALVCGLPEDRTLLIVDWLLLACADAGLVAQAVPLAAGDGAPYGMYLEVAADEGVEHAFGEAPWGAVDLLVAGEHLELLRAIDSGFADPAVTTIVASCMRRFTSVERDVAPQHVLAEQEIDAAARAASIAYHAFDGPEVAGWYQLPAAAQPGLLLGAIAGTGMTGLEDGSFEHAIRALGVDAQLHGSAFRHGTRLGRRAGGRIRRVRTAYQFTRRRRKLVDHRSRVPFEQLVARAEELVEPEHLPVLQEAIFRLTQFQDAEWATKMVDHLASLISMERSAPGAADLPAHRSIVPDAVRSLAALMIWPDAAWIANRKIRDSRLKEIRAAHGINRARAYELVDHVPLDALDRSATRRRQLPGMDSTDPGTPPLLQPLRVEQIRTTTLKGARRLRTLADAARLRPGSPRQQLEIDTLDAWLEAMQDALRVDHRLARIVARSGTLVQGSGAVREANRATAHAFWGRIVRQTIAIDRAAGESATSPIASHVIPFVWEQLCRSGPLALWEYAAQVLGIALAHARGLSWEATIAHVIELCEPRRPVEGR